MSVRISARRTKAPVAPIEDDLKTKVDAVMPQSAQYGIFGPQYAAALAAKKESTAANIMDIETLKNMSELEAIRYRQDLAAANAEQRRMQASAAYYNILSAQDKALQGDVDRGMGGARHVSVDENGQPVITYDEPMIRRANNNVLNADEADRVKTKAEGYGVLAEKLGYRPSADYLAKDLTNPNSDPAEGPMPIETYHTYDQETNRYKADEGMTVEEQLQLAREHGNKDSEGNVTVTVGEGGVAQTVYKGTPEQIRQQLINDGRDPNTGRKLGPKAGPQGGGAPATPAANAPKQVGENTIRPVRNGRAIAAQLYPQGHITEVERDPNAKYGAANSWHKRSHAAIDMRPIKGMTFDQYVQGYRDAGYEIIESRDEVKHPSDKATGPHWHVVVGNPVNTEQIYARRLAQLPQVVKAEVVNGRTLVTLRGGKQLVYSKGRRVG